MLFNSHLFLFVFFPAVLAFYSVVSRYGRTAALSTLLVASLFFYAWWDVRFLPLLGLSILGNYAIGVMMTRAASRERDGTVRILLTLGVTLNLLVLGFFKYTNFFVKTLDAAAGTNIFVAHIILPLGISFFTFEQIGYLIDIRRGHVYRPDILSYAVFVSFFPRLVAGPILRYSEIEPQLGPLNRARKPLSDLAIGLSIFVIGLCKKSFLADGIAPHVGAVFTSSGQHVDFFFAWGGVLAYTFQLYFDFSGYSDMAIGIARCFGIKFPVNFLSPYKAANIIEFWRCWHMTLSRFLRDYLYIPLGGGRRGSVRRYANLLLTMLLGGLWHGANWTFVCWGGLHGLYLIINHGWDALMRRAGASASLQVNAAWRFFARLLTFLAVVVAWVFFRSPDFTTAANLLNSMAGGEGASLPNALLGILGRFQSGLALLGINFGTGSGREIVSTYCWIAALAFIAFALPNTQELLSRFQPGLLPSGAQHPIRLLAWRWSLTPGWAVAAGALAFLGIISITRVSEFLYWQF